MQNQAQEIRNIDVEIEEAKKAIGLRDALVRLEKNRDFKKVFSEYFLKEFATNTVELRGHPAFRSQEALMEANLRKLDAIGEVYEFMRNVKANGASMDQALIEAEATRDEVLAEVE